MRIAVIGAGAAGLCAGRHALDAHHSVVVFEQTADVGGTWVYTDQVDVDECGLPVHTSMYKGLRTNLPKEIMCYPDYPIPDQPASYIAGTDIHSYLESFADHFHVREHIRFRHEVIRVRPIGDNDKWEVVVRKIITDSYETMQFDAVIVCNGHYSQPKIPAYDGLDQYKGHFVHSKTFRDADQYKGKSVLIVGLGASGFDIGRITAAVAKRIAISSYHDPVIFSRLSEHIERKPDIRRFTESEVEFLDGSIDRFDHIIFCTGYKHSYPFLSVDSGLTVEEDSFIRPLFKQCINIEHPTMMLPGLVYRVCPFQVIDVQVRFFLAFLGGHRQLPTKAEMLAITADDMQKSLQKNGSKRRLHQLDSLQAEYYNDLSTVGGVENVKPYVVKIYEATDTFIKENHTTNYRRLVFRIVDDNNFTSALLDE